MQHRKLALLTILLSLSGCKASSALTGSRASAGDGFSPPRLADHVDLGGRRTPAFRLESLRTEADLASPAENPTRAIGLGEAVSFALSQPGSPKLVAVRASTLGRERANFTLPRPGSVGPAGPEIDAEQVIYVEAQGVDFKTHSPDGSVRDWHHFKALLDQRTGAPIAEYWW